MAYRILPVLFCEDQKDTTTIAVQKYWRSEACSQWIFDSQTQLVHIPKVNSITEKPVCIIYNLLLIKWDTETHTWISSWRNGKCLSSPFLLGTLKCNVQTKGHSPAFVQWSLVHAIFLNTAVRNPVIIAEDRNWERTA